MQRVKAEATITALRRQLAAASEASFQMGFASELVRGPKDPAARVGIKVRGQDGAIVHFKVLRTSALKKVADAYAQRQGGAPGAYRFVFEGNDIFKHNAAVTPDDLEMEDGEMIDAMLEQTGGRGGHTHRVE